jgi:uncharacterized damage-inducible protein DinB
MLAETEDYLYVLNSLQEQMIGIIDGVPAVGLNWRPIVTDGERVTNSIAALVTHVAGAERVWVAKVIGGKESDRDRPAEFAVVVENADELITNLKVVGEETRKTLSELTNKDLARLIETYLGTHMVRWAIVHLIEHIALHLGEMQITYQLWEAGFEPLKSVERLQKAK